MKGNVIRRLVRAAAPAAVLLTLAACATPPPPYPELPRLAVSTQITSRNMCGMGVSPAINIRNAPAAATQYRLRLVNVDVIFQEPWQTTVAASPDGYREGALADYEGPCIGERAFDATGSYFTYRFEALALDAQNRPVAYGQTSLPIRSIGATVERERATGGGQPAPFPADLPSPMTVNPMINPALYPRLPGPSIEP